MTCAAFADEYYVQLQGVFARQSLVPTYGVERVRALIECLEPTGRLLLLRAMSPDGRSIASGIFPAFKGTAYFWGGASLRDDQALRPNEAIFWYAMRYWRARGMTAGRRRRGRLQTPVRTAGAVASVPPALARARAGRHADARAGGDQTAPGLARARRQPRS